MLIHGFGLSSSHYRKSIAELSKKYKVRVVQAAWPSLNLHRTRAWLAQVLLPDRGGKIGFILLTGEHLSCTRLLLVAFLCLWCVLSEGRGFVPASRHDTFTESPSLPSLQVYAVDLLGFGASSKPTTIQYSMELWRDQVSQLIGFAFCMGWHSCIPRHVPLSALCHAALPCRDFPCRSPRIAWQSA